jgi:hypothetical protein
MFKMDPAPPAISDAVSHELAGERVLWAASPNRWAYANKYWKTALFGIPFAAFSIFWTYMATHGSKGSAAVPLFFPLWGLMFVGIGLAMLASPLFAAFAARNVYYVVTERRAVIFEKALRLSIRSFDGSSLGGFERASGGGMAGSIIFQRIIERRGKGTRITEVGFIGLRDFAAAEQALRSMIAPRQ